MIETLFWVLGRAASIRQFFWACVRIGGIKNFTNIYKLKRFYLKFDFLIGEWKYHMLWILRGTISMNGSFEDTKQVSKFMNERAFPISNKRKKKHVVGAWEGRLSETVLLSTQTSIKIDGWESFFSLTPKDTVSLCICVNENLGFLFMKENICCGCMGESSLWEHSLSAQGRC